jgi:hypothetical protein
VLSEVNQKLKIQEATKRKQNPNSGKISTHIHLCHKDNSKNYQHRKKKNKKTLYKYSVLTIE